MDTFWLYWGWCLVPLLFVGLMALACVVMAFRGAGSSGCGCAHGMGGTPPSKGA